MTTEQKTVKIFAIVLATLICVSIFGVIVRGLGFMVAIFDDDYEDNRIYEEISTSDINIGSIDKISVDIGALELEMISGNEFKIEKSKSDLNVSIRTSGSTIKIEERSHDFLNFGRTGKITITVPTSMNLDKLSIEQGAGTVKISGIYTRNFEFEQGAGTLTIENCQFDRTDLDGGVGKMTVRASTLKDLDLNAGVGAIDIDAVLLGKTDIDGGVGSINLNIRGEKEDYTFHIEKGLGSITVDGTSQSGNFGDGANRIEVEGGVGSIKINFN